MATRDQIDQLLGHGHTYETAARELEISPGLAYMIATGSPADGGEPPQREPEGDSEVAPASTQQLVNPRPFNPTRNATVIEWVQGRAARELGGG